MLTSITNNLRTRKSKRTTLVAVLSLLFLGFGISLITTGQANAFAPNYNPSNLIDDPTFQNNSSMSEGAIQSFLSNVGSGLANFTDVEACDSSISAYYPHCGQTVLAAQIIYDASQAYGINPRAILATLEKEQSLVTDPTPSASQLNCAMGYDSCGNYVGFFTQVDNGAWQLEFNYQRANGNSSWWNSSLPYRCGSAQSGFYNNGLIPGNTVTFNDSGGLAETVTIANAATASLYCYTPYVGPYSVTGYSGSYNFVYYYQLWFGSTEASTPYAWAFEGQGEYTDSGYSDPFTNTNGQIYMAPGQTVYLTVDARNVGYDTWPQSFVRLGTDDPENSSSQFANGSWLSPTRIAMQQSSVAPGSDATFDIPITAPSTPGTYNQHFNLVAEDITWMNDPGLFFTINVVQPVNPTPGPSNGLTSGQSLTPGQSILSPEAQSALMFNSNGDVILYADGKGVWSNGVNNSSASKLTMQSDGNLVEYSNTGQAIWNSVTEGNLGAHLNLQSDGNLVVYSSGGTPLWWSGTGSNPSYDDRVDQSIPSGGVLFPGQSLENASATCRLSLQTDGNLVEYNGSNQALWWSGTGIGQTELLAMQPDGDLVMYSTSGKPIWASNTLQPGASLVMRPSCGFDLESPNASVLWAGQKLYAGQSIVSSGYTLTMQSDGNLVIYDYNGVPVWNSSTEGTSGAYMTIQTDGNLVVYNSQNYPVWNSGTEGNGSSILAMQSDGNLVIYNARGGTWATGTAGR
ncbi:MAG TPA: hypothetical protein VMR95_03925 [Candidatus Binatia bacterium]|nr:hypothetical protein [Candidatus Binatia bacterium]